MNENGKVDTDALANRIMADEISNAKMHGEGVAKSIQGVLEQLREYKKGAAFWRSAFLEYQEELALTKQQLLTAESANSILSEELQATEAALKLSAAKYNQDAGVAEFVAVKGKDLTEHWKQRAEAAEQAIRESQEQEPISPDELDGYVTLHGYMPKLYTKPVIIPESAAQLHIKELRESIIRAMQDVRSYQFIDALSTLNEALAKQPDTSALEKALLEARIEALDNVSVWGGGESDIEDFAEKYKAKLAELNKE